MFRDYLLPDLPYSNAIANFPAFLNRLSVKIAMGFDEQ